MDLAYLGGSLAGVAVLVALNAVLFGTRTPRLTAARSEAYLAQVSPAFRIRNIALAEDGTAALVENDDGTLHLIVTHGDDLVMRKLTPTLVSGVTRDGPTLSMQLADFTLPRPTLRLGAAAALWERKLAETVR